MDHLESLFFFHDDGLPYFGRIIRFISMFPVDSFRKDTKVVLLGCFEGPHIFIDPEMGEFRIDDPERYYIFGRYLVGKEPPPETDQAVPASEQAPV